MATPSSQSSVVIQEITSNSDFPGYLSVEYAAFGPSPAMGLMSINDPNVSVEEARAAAISIREDIWRNDPSAHHLTAKLPDGKIVGIAKWNFFLDSGPQYPWPKRHTPNANVPMIEWFFDTLDEARNSAMKGKRHALMGVLAVHPDYQRMGIGNKLLEWGLARCDEEGLDCWIDASKAGKGLYEKFGWKEVKGIDIDLGRWGGKKGETDRIACMLRQPRKSQA